VSGVSIVTVDPPAEPLDQARPFTSLLDASGR
jgi:hypothetical protein